MANPPPCVDLLSDLPVGIIESILVCLPIRDAIRTSILSTNWRYRWTTIPHLVFVFVFDEDDGDNEESEPRFKSFVTQTLSRHKGPLQKVKISAEIDTCPITDQWLLSLSTQNIKELSLKFAGEVIDLPSYLYSFQSLTLLRLFYGTFSPPPPTFKGFPWLRTLNIQYLDVPILTIKTIVEQSPILETLCYAECAPGRRPASELIIRAPNLKYLKLELHCDCGINLYYYAPLLTKLSLSLDYGWDFHEKATYCYYTKFLGGFANLDTLVGTMMTKSLSYGIELYKHSLVFHRLKTIKLGKVNFKSTDEILVAIRLILDASATLCDLQLRSYKCKYGYIEDMSKIPGAHFWDSICPQNCTFGKLKFVEVDDFRGEIQEMNFIKFLLASSPVLEVLKVKPDHMYAKQDMLNSRVKLCSYTRASSSASILFDPDLASDSVTC